MEIPLLWGAIYAGYSVALRTLAGLFHEMEEDEIATWLTALWEADTKKKQASWSSEAERFWTTNDANVLMNMYYRGSPRQFVCAFGDEKNLHQMLQEKRTDWMLSVVDDAAKASECHLQTISADDFDLK